VIHRGSADRLVAEVALVAACAAVGCGGSDAANNAERAESQAIGRAAGPFRFVRPPIVQFDGQWFEATVRVNRPLPGGNAVAAYIDITGAAQDVPGLQRALGVRRCYSQMNALVDEHSPPRAGSTVRVTLTVQGRPEHVLRARVPVERVRLLGDRTHAAAVRRLGCPRAPPERRCDGEAAGGAMTIWTDAAAGGATCATARRVMNAVARWASSSRCFQDLCVSEHRMNAGFRCTVAKVGEADWIITCRRGRQMVRGSSAD
jgi:hypothetical protein